MVQFGRQFFATGAMGIPEGVTVIMAMSAVLMLTGLAVAALGARRGVWGLAPRGSPGSDAFSMRVALPVTVQRS